MKIAVIGTINNDLIKPYNKSQIESFGGISYTIMALSALLDSEDTIIPISYIGEDIKKKVYVWLKKYPNISLSGLNLLLQKNFRVELHLISQEKRREKALFLFPSLNWENIQPYIDSDIIIINMISGWDINLNTLTKLSKLVYNRIYLDLHYLFTSLDKFGYRLYSGSQNLKSWISNAYFIQMNEDEFKYLSKENKNYIHFYEKYFSKNQILLITQGAKGTKAIYRYNNKLKVYDCPAYKNDNIIDTTGCGDTFGAGFIVKYFQTKNVAESVRFGNLVAAANASFLGINELQNLNDTIDRIKQVNLI